MNIWFWETEREHLTGVCAVNVAYCVIYKILQTMKTIFHPLPVLRYRCLVTGTYRNDVRNEFCIYNKYK